MRKFIKKKTFFEVMGISIGSKLLKTVNISAVSLDLTKLQLKNRKKRIFLRNSESHFSYLKNRCVCPFHGMIV